MATAGDEKRKKTKKNKEKKNNNTKAQHQTREETMKEKKKKKNKLKIHQDREEAAASPQMEDQKTKKSEKRKLQRQGEDGDTPTAKQDRRRGGNKRRRKQSVVTDERFAAVHFDPRFQRVPKRESKVPIDARFARMLSDRSFASSSAPVDKRGRLKKDDAAGNSLRRYYHAPDEEDRREEEAADEDGGREIGSESGTSEDEMEMEVDESSSTDEDESDYDEDEDLIQTDISQYLMGSHEDTPLTEQETHRLAVVNMDWNHIKAVDLYVAINSCLPKGGQILSVGIYPSEYGLKCMEIEATRGPSALIDDKEENSEDESEGDDEDIRDAKLRNYELNKLRYYHGVAVFDSVNTANHVYTNLDGTELLRTSNVFDLRFIPDSMEFKHPPREMITEAPSSYSIPDFHTRALQHSKVKLTWEEDEPNRTKVLRRKFNDDQLDELNAYLASSGDSDAGDEEAESDGSEKENSEALPNGKGKKHIDREKLRALLLSGEASGSDKKEEEDQEMEITFNTGLENLSKRILEKKDKKSETVWEQVLRKRSEKRKARKRHSTDSSEDDSSDYDVQEAAEQPDDFFMDEEAPSDSAADVGSKKSKGKSKSRVGKNEESAVEDKEQEASRAELELLFADDLDGKGRGTKGYRIKPNKLKGKKGKEAALEAKIPDVDPSADPRFSALFKSHLFALDPTDPQYKRSAAYARQQLGKQRPAKGREQVEETINGFEQTEVGDIDGAPMEKEKHELLSTVRSLKRNLGNLKKGSKGR